MWQLSALACTPDPNLQSERKWQQSGPISLGDARRAGHVSKRHGPSVTEPEQHQGPADPLTDGSWEGQVPGLTAMLPKLLLDWLTIKISKEITVAHWQLLQLFAPAPLVFRTCLAWIRPTCVGHISPFHKWFTPESSSRLLNTPPSCSPIVVSRRG